MNRREFTARLGAVLAAPSLPFTAAGAAVATSSTTVPSGMYVWADLIVRAQNRASPEMLARQLRIAPEAASKLFQQLIADGVLKAPTVSGMARAVSPLHHPSHQLGIADRAKRLSQVIENCETQSEEPSPLVNSDDPCLVSQTDTEKDACDASPKEPL